MITIGVVFSVALLITLITRKYIIEMLCCQNNLKANYMGSLIPVSAGIIFLPGTLVGALVAILYMPLQTQIIYTFLFVIMAGQLIGLIDDQLGNRDSTGIKGHFYRLFKGKLTTGAFKAIMIGICGILVSLTISSNFIDLVINSLIIAMFSNAINLFDLRPGRALKVFVLLVIMPFVFAIISIVDNIYMVIMLGTVLGYISLDLKSRSMLGDCGANTLGIVLGFYYARAVPFNGKLLVVVFLIAIHVICERWSMSKIIEKNKFLTYLDRIGR